MYSLVTEVHQSRQAVCSVLKIKTKFLVPLMRSFVIIAPNGHSEEVLIPTWSEVNGQDDLVWHKAVKQADGSSSHHPKSRASTRIVRA